MEDRTGRLKALLDADTWSEEDRRWLLQYLENGEDLELRQLLLERLSDDVESEEEFPLGLSRQMLDRIHARIGSDIPNAKIRRLFTWTRFAAAASVLLLLSGATYFFWNHNPKNSGNVQTAALSPANDVSPGSTRAVLTLSNGQQIVLDEAEDGKLAKQGSSSVAKVGGHLVYERGRGNDQESEVSYNTISTPKGGQYQVVLPDGSKVWLNAASSLHYPVSFSTDQIVVEMTGECYFEVKHDPNRQFLVRVNGTTIKDIGTAFDVNAYMDEAVLKTTLVSGSVKVGEVTLLPGEQLNGERVEYVDAGNEIAWKDGFFSFNHAGEVAVLNQIARWYNVEVEYREKPVADMKISGRIGRDLTLSQVLDGLAKMNLKCEIRSDGKVVVDGR